ncbi:family 20 glycosylhydrolase [Bifidobacterium sp. ESL0764]|uniref:family 20 glycosylhydrolase n=1 Tax=Bifidobacterium sp. ESL0764 TaxID=2983228 RepID=UPI0023F77D1F|nr:family 20 glycosylhydrolase [Bifidobacterium sp. ESL0764]WEV65212.1 family 20 glycosylhydrolase [Bifidobacterium sp. ESL0764]
MTNVAFSGTTDSCERAWEDFKDLCLTLHIRAEQIIHTERLNLNCSDSPDSDTSQAIGINPFPKPVDERFSIAIHDDVTFIESTSCIGIYRALCTLLTDRFKATPDASTPCTGEAPCTFEDGPRYSYRALNLDVARYQAPVETIERVIDLLSVHRMSALHLHLTDNQSWRIPITGFERLNDQPGIFSATDLGRIDDHARKRHVAVIPEIDLPGHCGTLLNAYPELTDGTFRRPYLSYISPDAPLTERFLHACVDALDALSTGAYIHIGGDEVFGMPQDQYDRIIGRLIDMAHSKDKKTIAWQEASRSPVASDAYQYWMGEADIPTLQSLKDSWPKALQPFAPIAAQTYALCHDDPERFAKKKAKVIDSRQSWLYLDRKYAEPSLDNQQNSRMETLGFPDYEPRDSRDLTNWTALKDCDEAGVETALWAETIRNDDDIATLLLPRLALVAQLAWSGHVDSNAASRDEIARYTPLWKRLGFEDYYRSSSIFGQKGKQNDSVW